ncbi:Calx-beta domain protein [Gimesia panareensis]|uniref:Calx-beta domain protein n=1 Tax=Gimesia panareensis TaxID=2527978 RepID=A0A518FQM6_9PLAN|nr:Calx-beta domain-containing protein [Gimesia panareensis]QDV18654.1 Calx-beta domain protein [Gimesia panareensis]
MLLTNWLKSLTSRCRTARSRRPRHPRSRNRNRYQPALSRRPIGIEELEDRTLLTSLISIDDVSVVEGDVSYPKTEAVFTITRSGQTAGDLNSVVTVDYKTRPAPGWFSNRPDFDSDNGTIEFQADETALVQTIQITIYVLPDYRIEPDEYFDVILSNNSGDSIITKDTGTAEILTDDFKKFVEFESPANPSSVSNGDHFGNEMAVDGEFMIVGALDSDLAGDDSGAAYIYRLNNHGTSDYETDDTWEYFATLTAFDASDGDQFGSSVAIDGDTIVIGAYADNDSGSDSGSVYVYRWDTVNWTFEEKLTASDGQSGDHFGNSVAIEGDLLIVGANFRDANDSEFTQDAGAVYVFNRTGTAWSESQILVASNRDISDQFGWSVDIEDQTVFISSIKGDAPGSHQNTGAVYLFQYANETWVENTVLTAPDGAPYDLFGYDIDVDGDHLGVISTGTTEYKGTAYLFEKTGDNWNFQQKITPPATTENDHSAISVALSGNRIVIGSILSDGETTDTGAAFVYELVAGTWLERQTLSSEDGQTGDNFGYAVALTDSRIFVSAPLKDETGSDSGTFYVYSIYAPEISIIFSSYNLKEGDVPRSNVFSFVVSRKSNVFGGSNIVSTVNYTTVDGTATAADGDYIPKSGTITFTASDTATLDNAGITIYINGDERYEGDSPETFSIVLSDPSDGTILAVSEAVASIEEDDYSSLSIDNVTVNESDTSATLTVSLDQPVDEAVSVDFSTTDQTARASADFQGTTGTITFAPGETTKTITIPILNDNDLVEGDEAFLVDLSNIQTATTTVLFADDQGEVTIQDDDQAHLSIGDVTVDENAGTAAVVVSLDIQVDTAITVDYATADQSASAGNDYSSQSGTLTFNAGELTQTITVPIVDTDLVENEEFFLVNLSQLQASQRNVVLTDNQGKVTVTDDDQARLTIADVTVDESAGTAQVNVLLGKPVDGDISVDFATADQSATSPDDYQSQSGTLTLFAGQQTGTISIPLVNDYQIEADETFLLNLSQFQSHGFDVVLDDAQAQITIQNDDQVSHSIFTIDSQKILEGDDGTQLLQFTITRTGDSSGNLNFATQVQFDTVDGTATAGEDYMSTSVVLDFDADPSATMQTQTVEVTVYGDTLNEPTETILGRLSQPTAGSVLEGYANTLDATGVVTNDESDFQFQQSFTADVQFANHSYDHTGRYVAIDGDVMVIGVPNNRANEDNAPGFACIYTRNQQGTPADLSDDTWDFQTVLRPDDHPGLQYFGSSVAIHDDTILIGARDDAGRVLYIFTRVGDDWTTSPAVRESFALPTEDYHSVATETPLAVYNNTIVAANYLFEKTGADWSNPAVSILTLSSVSAIAMQEDTIVLGTSFDTTNGSRSGAVLIYTKTGSDWTTFAPHETKITASDAGSYQYFGQSVSINGNQLAVGAVNPQTSSSLGKAYIYTRNGSDWDTVAPDEVIFQADSGVYHFGASVALQDNHLVVGTYNEPYDTQASDIYVYTRNGASWDAGTASRTVLSAPASGNLLFGEKVFISGTTIFAGAPQGDTDGKDSGTIYVFELNQSDSYELIHEISPDISETAHNGGDEFGRRIVVSEDYLLIAATGSDSSDVTGVVYLYVKDNGGTPDTTADDRWVYETTFTAPDPGSLAGFGHSMAIDGDTILIAAKKTHGSEVYVYEKSGADWTTNSPVITRLLSSTSTYIGWLDDAATYPETFLAIQGDTIVVSDPFSTTDPSQAGQIYVFTRNGDDWSTLEPDRSILKASDTTARNDFGYHIDLDDGKIIVGAVKDGSNRGAAYLYLKGVNGWDDATEIKLVGTGTETSDQFGTTVAIDGNTVVVGAIGDDDSGSLAGAIYIYDASQGWDNLVETKVIPARIPNQDDYYGVGSYTQNFGGSIDIEGTTIVVGASSTGPQSNSVYIYDGTDGWDQVRESRISLPKDSEIYDRGFGATVAYHNNNLIVALQDKLTDSDVARVYSFTRPPRYNHLVQSQTVIPPAPLADGDHTGYEIVVDGDFMAVAANKSDLADTDAGVVYIYQRHRNDIANESDDTWEYHSTLTAFDAQEGDQFGTSLALDGDTLVIGAFHESTLGEGSGAAYVYRLNGSTWELEEKLTASDGVAGDYFGISVAIENNIIVVGASYRDSDSMLYNAAGAVYIFSRNGNNWSEVQRLTASNAAASYHFGTSVAIQNSTIFVSSNNAKASESAPPDRCGLCLSAERWFLAGRTDPVTS